MAGPLELELDDLFNTPDFDAPSPHRFQKGGCNYWVSGNDAGVAASKRHQGKPEGHPEASVEVSECRLPEPLSLARTNCIDKGIDHAVAGTSPGKGSRVCEGYPVVTEFVADVTTTVPDTVVSADVAGSASGNADAVVGAGVATTEPDAAAATTLAALAAAAHAVRRPNRDGGGRGEGHESTRRGETVGVPGEGRRASGQCGWRNRGADPCRVGVPAATAGGD